MAARIDPLQAILFAGLGVLALVTGLVAGLDPPMSLGLSGAVAYGLLVFANLPAALALYCSEPFGLSFQESGVMRIAVAILFVSWLGTIMVRDQRVRNLFAEHPAVSGALLLFLAWSLLSLTWAEDPGASWDTTSQYAAAAVIFLVTFTVVRTRQQASGMVAAFVAGAVVAAGFGLVTGRQDAGRLEGLSLDPNELATVVVPAIALAVALIPSVPRSPGLKLALGIAAGFCCVATLLTVSREAVFALIAMMTAAVLFSGRWRAAVTLLVAAAAISGSVYIVSVASPDSRDRILHAADSKTRFQEGRTSLWQVGWRIFEANPVRGVGAGNFSVSAKHYLLRPGRLGDTRQIVDTPKVSHSSFVEVLTGLGAVGLAMFLLIDLFGMVACVRAARRFAAGTDRAGEALARGVFVALVGLQVLHAFHSDESNKQLWFLLGLGLALLAIATARAERPADDAPA
jgi:O-antigen ligase